jgi:hypothetical protein
LNPASQIHLSEAAARRVLLLQAFESNPADDNPQWTFDDRVWATRVARDSVPASAKPAQFLADRAHHAMQRLAPRDAGVRHALQHRGWRWRWLLLALLLGFVFGLAADAIGSNQRINLLAPPVWVVIAWNLLVYLGLALSPVLPLPGAAFAKQWLMKRLAGGATRGAAPMARFRALWLQHGAPLLRPRAAMLLHGAAAAVAGGLIAGLYLRGLVLDYRAGWQSTFLDAEQVRAALAALLAPAVAFTGMAVPDVATVQALRVNLEAMPASSAVNSAALWIHLYAAMLLLFVVLPRSALMLMTVLRATTRSLRVPLALGDAYFQTLLREFKQQAARVQLLPHGAVPTPHALACLQTVLAPLLGSSLQTTTAAATAYGDEDQAGALQPAPGTTLRLALMDLAATPEDDTHGAFVRALRKATPGVQLLVLCDETAFSTRFASMPERLQQRRAAWQAWAQQAQVGWLSVNLAQPDKPAAESALRAAMNSAINSAINSATNTA